MFPEKCKAILSADDNNILEPGTVTASIADKSAEFTGKFVPLFMLGTPVRLFCYENGFHTHTISGKVYISTSEFLRVVDIQTYVCPDAEIYGSAEIEMRAKILSSVQKTGVFRSKITRYWTDCTVCSISAEKITFYSQWQKSETNDFQTIRLGMPVFTSPVEISLRADGKHLIFGKNYKYTYSIIDENPKTKKGILDFIRQYHIYQLGDTYSK